MTAKVEQHRCSMQDCRLFRSMVSASVVMAGEIVILGWILRRLACDMVQHLLVG